MPPPALSPREIELHPGVAEQFTDWSLAPPTGNLPKVGFEYAVHVTGELLSVIDHDALANLGEDEVEEALAYDVEAAP